MAARIDDPDARRRRGLGARAASTPARSARPACRSGASCRSRRSCSRQGVRDMVRISDARMSGTSYGACVLHVAPESFVGGPLALVRDGDLIELDVPARRLELKVERRRARAPPRRVEAAAAAVRARLRRALPAAHHAGQPGLRLRFPRRHRADAGSGDSLMMRRSPRSEARRTSSPRSCTARGCGEGEARDHRAPARRFQSRRPRFARRAARAAGTSTGSRDGTLQAQHGADDRLRQRHDRDRRRQSRLRPGHRRVRDEARHREGARRRASRWSACAIAGTSDASATGPTWRRRRARCRCTFSTRRARSASRPSAAATAGCRPIRSRSACRSTARDPVVLDVTTSMVAEGKLMVALNKGEQVPEGWIIDKHGTPTTEPEGFLRRRRAAHRRRAQGLGAVDRHRSARRRGVDRPQLRCRRSDPAQQHAVDLHRAGRVRRRRRRARARRGASSIS